MYIGTHQVTSIPNRIISLVPSITELLYSLGLDEQTIGITSFCIHPDHWYRQKKRIGGTKSLKVDSILSLKPDLIIANREENRQDQVEFLSQTVPVWLTDISSPKDCLSMIRDIGIITGCLNQAETLIRDIQQKLDSISPFPDTIPVSYLIWKDPYMTIGGDTYINNLMPLAGFRNVWAEKTRYPEITTHELIQSGCGAVLLSSEPYPFKEKHAIELSEDLMGIPIHIVDGEMFSWYGSRLLQAIDYLQELGKSIRKTNH